MAKYILDTCMLVGYVRGAGFAEYAEAKYAVSTPPNIAVISTVSVGEVRSLAIQFGWGDEKKELLSDVLRRIPHLGIGHPQILDRYAEIDAYSKGKHPEKHLPGGKTAKPMGKNDIWIAATGSVLNATLLTTDGDFNHLNGTFLRVIQIDQKWTAADAVVGHKP